MNSPRPHIPGIPVVLALLVCFGASGLMAQRNRITGPIQNGRRMILHNQIHPMARIEDDQGPVDPSLKLRSVTLALKQSASQQADLEKFLAEQQDPSSANYHHWLTPEEYADRFGASQDDLNKITSWLQQQKLTVIAVARARNSVTLSGTAAQVENAFGTKIHRFQVDGEMHYANATDPTIPEALGVIVEGIRGLNDFHLKPKRVIKRPLANNALQPNYTSSRGNHYLAPDDVATIYNLKPLYDAGINGTGQKLVVVGQTQINLSDLQLFRSSFGLPASDPQLVLVPNSADPGIVSDDLPEAHLDLEWAGAVARNANLIYVYSTDVIDSLQYAIDQNLAPVISMSYGLCETQTSRSDALIFQSWARQANAQGATWFAASGDSGAADCATNSRSGGCFSVDLPAAIPEVTGVGGTTFNEGTGAYWNSANGPTNASVLSYIPEAVWNDTGSGDPASGGGGFSVVFAQPSWQVGAGVPNEGSRNVPDVSLAASAEHDGFLIYSSGNLQVVGGTSVSAPAFAGIATLLNHHLVSTGAQSSAGLGNMNPRLYSLAQTASSAFHDITAGNNSVTITCSTRARNCVSGTYGYDAAVGYDRASGLGSVDAYNLVSAWGGAGATLTRGTAQISVTSSASAMATSESVTLTATVRGANGGTPLGSVTFFLNSAALGTAALSANGDGSSTASLIVSGTKLVVGADTVTAQYSGDSAYNSATATVVINVTAGGSSAFSLTTLSNGASFRQVYAPGMILSIFGSQLAQTTWSAPSVPLPTQVNGTSVSINGVAAPLYYVSPGQLNVQIPYETTANATATVTVTSNGQTVSRSIAVGATAPGIFTDQNGVVVPYKTAARGQVVTLFITGEGSVSPAVATGSTPASATPLANLPKPTRTVTVTVGGASAPIQFIGIPSGLVGATQINYQVPAAAPLGSQAVIVTVGGIGSTAASLTVTN